MKKNKLWIYISVVVIASLLVYGGLNALIALRHNSVIVNDDAMKHDAPFDIWWVGHMIEYQEFNITKDQFQAFPFHTGIEKKTLAVYEKRDIDQINIGDVIVVKVEGVGLFAHRIVSIFDESGTYYVKTKADANRVVLPFESKITNEQIQGIVIKTY